MVIDMIVFNSVHNTHALVGLSFIKFYCCTWHRTYRFNVYGLCYCIVLFECEWSCFSRHCVCCYVMMVTFVAQCKSVNVLLRSDLWNFFALFLNTLNCNLFSGMVPLIGLNEPFKCVYQISTMWQICTKREMLFW